jgi:hypothetical protein
MTTTAGKKSTARKKSPAAKKAAPAAGAAMADVRAAAKALGISSFGKTKRELIRAIQRAEGNFDCYGTATAGYCDQTGCAWHPDCLKESVQ